MSADMMIKKAKLFDYFEDEVFFHSDSDIVFDSGLSKDCKHRIFTAYKDSFSCSNPDEWFRITLIQKATEHFTKSEVRLYWWADKYDMHCITDPTEKDIHEAFESCCPSKEKNNNENEERSL